MDKSTKLEIESLRGLLEGARPWSDERKAALIRLHEAARAEHVIRKRNGGRRGPFERLEIALFGNPEKKLEKRRRRGCGFDASMVDGPTRISLEDIAGMEFTVEEHDAVWGATNWHELVDECHAAEVETEEEFEGGPGMSDVFYWVYVKDPVEFARQVRTKFMEFF
jgi:hypothetical protein